MRLPYACSLIFSGEYEVVMVAKMRKKWSGDEDTFNHFMLGFPSTWLAIPFSDTLRREFVCKSLGLNSGTKYPFLDQNHNQKVYVGDFWPLHSYYLVFRSGVPCWEGRCGLDTMLDCKPTDLVSKKGGGGDDTTVSISELDNKLVGLYLCVDGSFLSRLSVIYQGCKDRNLEFEIVLVYIPFDHPVTPQVFQDAINHVLDQKKLSAAWWVAPFSQFVSHRLMDFCDCDWNLEDALIVFGPHNKFVELKGKNVITEFGIDAYPFTMEHIIQRDFEKFRTLSLESLLVHGSPNFVVRTTPKTVYYGQWDRVPVTELQGKMVLLYVDSIQSLDFELYHRLLSWYIRYRSNNKTPDSDSDFEVVFVDLEGGNESSLRLMPWLLCFFDPLRSAFVKNTFGYYGGFLTPVGERNYYGGFLAAFGKNGQLISSNATLLLESHGPQDFLSYDGLRDEIATAVYNRALNE